LVGFAEDKTQIAQIEAFYQTTIPCKKKRFLGGPGGFFFNGHAPAYFQSIQKM